MICVRATQLHQNTLHSLDPTSAETSDLGVVGWFPLLHSTSGRLVFLRTERMGDPDWLMVANFDGSSVIDARQVQMGEHYGPPLFWSDSSRVVFSMDAAGTTYIEVNVDTGRSGRPMSFDGGSLVSIAAIDDDRWFLVRSADRRSLLWATRDGKVASTLATGESISADFDHIGRVVAILDPPSDSLRWVDVDGSEASNMRVSDLQEDGQWDWWRPVKTSDGWTSLSIGLDTVLIDRDGHRVRMTGAIHASLGEHPADVERQPEEPSPTAVTSVPKDVVVTAPQGAVFPLLKTWTHDVPILLYSGCAWSCMGGGQRPDALAKELVRFGHPTYYYSKGHLSGGISGGVTVLSQREIGDAMDVLLDKPGVLFIEFPLPVEEVQPFLDAGWKLIYDMLDNWSGFTNHGDLPVSPEKLEAEMIRVSDVVTCSDQRLCERADQIGASHSILIKNGGLAALQPRNVPPSDMAYDARHLVTYLGHIHGSWFDWDLVREIDRHDDLAITMIGGWVTEKFRRTRFIGERRHPDAIRYLAAADVGIIPFCNPEISRYVDPIKAYDYWSAGIWCVCTPELESMVGRPYTIVSDREHFADAIREASEKRHEDPPTAEWVADNSWASRAKQLVDVVREFFPDPRSHATHVAPRREVSPGQTGLRVSIQCPSTCNMYPPCPYCGSYDLVNKQLSPWSRPAGEWLDALTRFFDQHAPVFASACWGETLSDRDSLFVWREIAQGHRMELVTNLLFKTKFLDPLPRNGNVVLVTSFHPHKLTIDEFISRRQAVIDSGLGVGRVLVVGYPPNLPEVEGWNDRFSELGWQMELIPFKGMYDGMAFPASYRGNDLDMIQRYLRSVHGRCDLLYDSPSGKRCLAGSRYCCIKWDGEVIGCGESLFAPRLGNIFSKDPIRMLPEPTVCESDCCSCPDLWQFVLDGRGAV